MPTDTFTPADVRQVWPEVRHGLEHVIAKTQVSWRPEDVYHSLLSGVAHLYLAPCGFVVVQPKEDPFTGEPELLVWVAYSREPGASDRLQPALDALAREHGFKKLTLWSSRAGWERTPGWNAVSVVYERRLDDV